MADFQKLAPYALDLNPRDPRQDRIVHRFESLCDQRRADDARRIARTQRDQAAAPASRYRQWEKIAQEIDDVPEVVGESDAIPGVAADLVAIQFGQSDRAADTRVIAEI